MNRELKVNSGPLSWRVLLVCKGNICRSALAENVLRGLAGRDLAIRSRGMRGWHEGKGAHPTMIRTAKQRGYDLTGHVAHQITGDDVAWAQEVLVFDVETLRDLRNRHPGVPSTAIKLYLQSGEDVLDPYGLEEHAFVECAETIERGAVAYLEKLRAGFTAMRDR